MNKIDSMAANAYARCIYPVGTMADGDTVYAASTPNAGHGSERNTAAGSNGFVYADINAVGTLAADVMAKAILTAVNASQISDEEFLASVT